MQSIAFFYYDIFLFIIHFKEIMKNVNNDYK